MSKLSKKYIRPHSSFALIKNQYEKIDWEEITPKKLENMLTKINVDFSKKDSNEEDPKERIEYLKELLEYEKSNSIITTSLQSERIISKIEALKATYRLLSTKNIESLEALIQNSISELELHLEEQRTNKINESKAEADREKEEKLRQEEQDRLDAEEVDRLEEENRLQEEEEEARLEEENRLQEEEDESRLEEEHRLQEDEESQDDETYNNYEEETSQSKYATNSVISENHRLSSKKIIHEDTVNRTINRQNINRNTTNNSTINNELNEEGNNEVFNKLVNRIDQLESMINSNEKLKDGNIIGEKSNEFSLDEDTNDFTISSNPMDEFSNDGIEFGDIENNEFDFKNEEKSFGFSSQDNEFNSNKDNNEFSLKEESGGNDPSNEKQLINDLMQRISILETGKNIDSENNELRIELDSIKKNISELNNKKPNERKLDNSPNIVNKTKIIKTFQKIYKQIPQTNKTQKIQNNKITNLIKETNLSEAEKEKLRKEILSNILEQQKVGNSETNSGATLTPKEMEDIILGLSEKIDSNQINTDKQNAFNTPSTQSDPFANIGNSQSDPFANMGNSQSDPFANMGNSQSDPFANMSNSQSDPFANMGNSQSDPFANMSNSQSDPFADVGGNTFHDNDKASGDVLKLQKQIKELQKIVLGKHPKETKFQEQRKELKPKVIEPSKPKEWAFDKQETQPNNKNLTTKKHKKPSIFRRKSKAKRGGDKW